MKYNSKNPGFKNKDPKKYDVDWPWWHDAIILGVSLLVIFGFFAFFGGGW